MLILSSRIAITWWTILLSYYCWRLSLCIIDGAGRLYVIDLKFLKLRFNFSLTHNDKKKIINNFKIKKKAFGEGSVTPLHWCFVIYVKNNCAIEKNRLCIQHDIKLWMHNLSREARKEISPASWTFPDGLSDTRRYEYSYSRNFIYFFQTKKINK